MQAVILAGGLGTRISEESHLRPKPMIEIGGRPILWHIMKMYAAHGITDFVVCLGYRGYMIKEYFANYLLHSSDVTIDARTGEIVTHQSTAEPWRVSLIDTGEATMTGGRLKRVAGYLEPTFCLTYGDGVADIDITAEIAFHRGHGREATVAAVIPPGRYGALQIGAEGAVERFTEKPPGDEGLIKRLLRAGAPGDRPDRGRRHPFRGGAAGEPCPRRRADGLPPPRLLARDGHDARQGAARAALGRRPGALEGLGLSAAREGRKAPACEGPEVSSCGAGTRRGRR